MCKHPNLIQILSCAKSWDEQAVARWCGACGAIVVDRDYDGRTMPGAIMQMRLPSSTKEKQGE